MKKIIILFVLVISSLFANEDYTVISDLKYGDNKLQTLDIYLPKEKLNNKVIFMVHGGAWRFGDKANTNVILNKVPYFTLQGYIFVSVNYRLVPEVNVFQQKEDILKALLYTQNYLFDKYNIQKDNYYLMGHSAGGHLVSLINSTETNKNWKAVISIDTAGYDLVETILKEKRILYYQALGREEANWTKLSPYHQLKASTTPFLLICSTQRNNSCDDAFRFKQKLNKFSSIAELLKIDLNHSDLNKNLGLYNDYTLSVSKFLNKY